MLNVPTVWKTFKTYPDDEKREYIEQLRCKYQPTTGELADMFGVSRSTVLRLLQRLNFPLWREDQQDKEHKEKWNTFLALAANTEESLPNLPELFSEESSTAKLALTQSISITPKTMRTTTVSLLLEGEFSIDDLVSALANAPIPAGEVTVRVNITEK